MIVACQPSQNLGFCFVLTLHFLHRSTLVHALSAASPRNVSVAILATVCAHIYQTIQLTCTISQSAKPYLVFPSFSR